ncbi:carboxypeptidase-like regulatory domain-containing protein [Galbibacter mesophilus]|nr:carboxypeptidase-like regulatory domain-containing protein [Galbibacter mesophilus]
MAKPQDSLQNIKFSITNENGFYELELKNIPYQISVSHMGYAAYDFQFIPNNKATVKNIILNEKAEELSEVVVEIPILVKKDTIVYNVNQLTNGDERKLKDVLKKLPGVEVSRDGVVTVQGKKVTTLLVENKKFFGGGTKLGVDNIPADALDQIEVIDNYNEIPMLKDLVDSDEMAMNIKLKEDKKNFVFGDVEVGKGNQDFYNLHSNLFYYSPKTTVNFIANTNNIAEEVFTYDQYFDFQSGLNTTFKKGGTSFELPNSDFLQFIESNDVISSNRKFGAINITKEVNEKLNISGYGVFSHTQEGTLSQSINRYNTFTEAKDVASETDNVFAIGNIEAAYLPNLSDAWYFKTKFKKTDNEYENIINSRVDTLQNVFLTEENAKGSLFNQTVEWHRKKSRKHTFSAALNYTFEEGLPNKFWQTQDDILQGVIPVVEDSIYRLRQQKQTRSNKLDAIFKHYWVLNKNNHIYSTFGNTYYGQSFFTSDNQELTNGTKNDFGDSGFGNDLDFNLNDLYFGINYKFRSGIFTFNQGVFMHYYHWKLEQDAIIYEDQITLLPNFSVEAEFNRLKKIEMNYERTTSFSEASKFANNFYLQSYNAVYSGNESLRNELFHKLSLRFNKYSGYKGFRLFFNVKYIKKTDGVIEDVNYTGINQTVSPVFVNSPESMWNFFGSLKKNIKDVNCKIGLNYNNSQYLQLANGILGTNKNGSLSYNVSAKTLFDKFPTVEVGFKQSRGNYTLSGRRAEFITNEPFVNFDYDFLKGFVASFDYVYYGYENKTLNQQNNYEIANASLYYKKDDSPWSFEIEARNVFDVNFKNRNSFSSYIISDTQTFILPRILMFTLGYNL